ncbi:unnamed protein product [Amoebophrya sp. A120]|nr:unnamed protein product [Amoebophrya sp. A120]|eukprot:GSA120T00025226001.1
MELRFFILLSPAALLRASEDVVVLSDTSEAQLPPYSPRSPWCWSGWIERLPDTEFVFGDLCAQQLSVHQDHLEPENQFFIIEAAKKMTAASKEQALAMMATLSAEAHSKSTIDGERCLEGLHYVTQVEQAWQNRRSDPRWSTPDLEWKCRMLCDLHPRCAVYSFTSATAVCALKTRDALEGPLITAEDSVANRRIIKVCAARGCSADVALRLHAPELSISPQERAWRVCSDWLENYCESESNLERCAAVAAFDRHAAASTTSGNGIAADDSHDTKNACCVAKEEVESLLLVGHDNKQNTFCSGDHFANLFDFSNPETRRSCQLAGDDGGGSASSDEGLATCCAPTAEIMSTLTPMSTDPVTASNEKCTLDMCRSPSVFDQHNAAVFDCWAGTLGESSFPCGGRNTVAQKTGKIAQLNSEIYFQYTCCAQERAVAPGASFARKAAVPEQAALVNNRPSPPEEGDAPVQPPPPDQEGLESEASFAPIDHPFGGAAPAGSSDEPAKVEIAGQCVLQNAEIRYAKTQGLTLLQRTVGAVLPSYQPCGGLQQVGEQHPPVVQLPKWPLSAGQCASACFYFEKDINLIEQNSGGSTSRVPLRQELGTKGSRSSDLISCDYYVFRENGSQCSLYGKLVDKNSTAFTTLDAAAALVGSADDVLATKVAEAVTVGKKCRQHADWPRVQEDLNEVRTRWKCQMNEP